MKLFKKLFTPKNIFLLISILAQLFFLVGVIVRFYDYFAFFYGASVLVSSAVVLWIINNKSNPAYKMAWIIPILIFPIFGGLFYIFFGGNKLSKRTKRKLKCIEDKTKKVLMPKQEILEEIGSKSEDAAFHSRYIQNYSYFPVHDNSTSEYLPIGEAKFERLKEELKKAKHYIFLEYYIIEEGVMWNSILKILVEKVKAGVDVRVIYDYVGCMFTLPNDYYKKLEKMGIKCCVFNPIKPVLSFRINNRDHRKIAVIDGHTGFTGGINLADEYINGIEKYGHWKDTAIMLKGDAVWNLTVMFISMWDFLKGGNEDLNQFKKNVPLDKEIIAEGYYQPFSDNPLDDEAVGETVYMNLLNKARKYVYITTPYLIIDNEMITALCSASKGGIDVRIITPYMPDKKLVQSVTRSYYKVLIESGVKIYEYTPGFIHAKMYVSDDEYGVVGTINMDFRSLFLHFECGVLMYGSKSLLDIKKDYLDTLKLCKEVTLEEVKNIKRYKTLTGSILRVFAPLM